MLRRFWKLSSLKIVRPGCYHISVSKDTDIIIKSKDVQLNIHLKTNRSSDRSSIPKANVYGMKLTSLSINCKPYEDYYNLQCDVQRFRFMIELPLTPKQFMNIASKFISGNLFSGNVKNLTVVEPNLHDNTRSVVRFIDIQNVEEENKSVHLRNPPQESTVDVEKISTDRLVITPQGSMNITGKSPSMTLEIIGSVFEKDDQIWIYELSINELQIRCPTEVEFSPSFRFRDIGDIPQVTVDKKFLNQAWISELYDCARSSSTVVYHD